MKITEYNAKNGCQYRQFLLYVYSFINIYLYINARRGSTFSAVAVFWHGVFSFSKKSCFFCFSFFFSMYSWWMSDILKHFWCPCSEVNTIVSHIPGLKDINVILYGALSPFYSVAYKASHQCLVLHFREKFTLGGSHTFLFWANHSILYWSQILFCLLEWIFSCMIYILHIFMKHLSLNPRRL